ncbi:hypothetical protein [Thalassospira povalilytica]|uniref:hypothetical protein n=1 Tax=Thalassospira povalilytica TaxID=732237 RepID=UPI001D190D7C|nr:hypothetical protein [Thalassospira povalilytica]MCC4240332.1 hypothetical protein [Thalassospira povalilytica]
MTKPMLIEALKPGMRAKVHVSTADHDPVVHVDGFIKWELTWKDCDVETLKSVDYEIIPPKPEKRPNCEQQQCTVWLPDEVGQTWYEAAEKLAGLIGYQGAAVGDVVKQRDTMIYIPVFFPDKHTRDFVYDTLMEASHA